MSNNNNLRQLLQEAMKIVKDYKKTLLLDVDQTVYDKGQWDLEFLQLMQENNLPIKFATHGTTAQFMKCPVQYELVELDTKVIIDPDTELPMLNEKDMPICLKVVPDDCILLDNMKKYYDLAGMGNNVIDKQFIK